jgi:hypothetical protein
VIKILSAMALVFASQVYANQVSIRNEVLGSSISTPIENAFEVDNNVFHAPQYMPGYPTSAVIYPRVIDTTCEEVATSLNCSGYHWLPSMGRAEYLFFKPNVIRQPEREIVEQIVVVPVERVTPTPKKKSFLKKKRAAKQCTPK